MADSSPSEPDSDSTPSRRHARRARSHKRRRQVLTVVATVLVLALATIIATDSVRFGGDDRPSLAETVDATPRATHVPSTTSTTLSTLSCRSNLTSTDPLKLWVGGDSLAGALGPALGTLAGATGVVQPYFHSRVSSGLSNPTFVDWPTLGTKEMTAVTPEIVVFIISTNDYPVALNKTLDANGELAWKAPYTKEVDDMMKTLEGSGRTVLWLGAPVLGDTKQNDAIKELNAVEKEVAKKHPTVVYFDTYALFADADGKYSVNVTDSDGKTITARSGDGVHFTMDGANYLARAVFKVVDAQCKIAAQAVTGVTKATIQTPGSTQVAPGSGGSGGNVGTTPPATGSNTATTSPPTATTSARGDQPTRTTTTDHATDHSTRDDHNAVARTHRPGRDAPAGPSVTFAHARPASRGRRRDRPRRRSRRRGARSTRPRVRRRRPDLGRQARRAPGARVRPRARGERASKGAA